MIVAVMRCRFFLVQHSNLIELFFGCSQRLAKICLIAQGQYTVLEHFSFVFYRR